MRATSSSFGTAAPASSWPSAWAAPARTVTHPVVEARAERELRVGGTDPAERLGRRLADLRRSVVQSEKRDFRVGRSADVPEHGQCRRTQRGLGMLGDPTELRHARRPELDERLAGDAVRQPARHELLDERESSVDDPEPAEAARGRSADVPSLVVECGEELRGHLRTAHVAEPVRGLGATPRAP